jgi:hypothetical protein
LDVIIARSKIATKLHVDIHGYITHQVIDMYGIACVTVMVSGTDVNTTQGTNKPSWKMVPYNLQSLDGVLIRLSIFLRKDGEHAGLV